MRQTIYRALFAAAAIFALAAADVGAQGNWQPGDFGALRFRLGILQPQADSQFWDDYFTDFTGSSGDFEDLVFGIDYLWRNSRQSGLLFGGSFYEGQTTLGYRDWESLEGGAINHLTTLRLSDLTAAYLWRFGRTGARPYVGVGGGLLWWQFREDGSFIDFGSPDLPIIYASYLADGTTWELFGLAGFDIPLSYRWSFFFEGRYRWAEAELNRDFSGFGTIDLSGVELAGGISWNF